MTQYGRMSSADYGRWLAAGGNLAKAIPPVVSEIDVSALVPRATGGLTDVLGPGLPILPSHQDERQPRWWDYIAGQNIGIQPRAFERYSFDVLYDLANSWDVAGLAILKRVEEFARLEWSIRPVAVPGQSRKQAQERKAKFADTCAEVTGFLRTPDQQSQWSAWITRYLDDLFKGDCATLYMRPALDGSLYGVEVIDGRTILPYIDLHGRIGRVPPGTPRHIHEWAEDQQTTFCRVCDSPAAYAQVIKGQPWIWFGSDEILYEPKWPRPRGQYGHPPAEWIILSINRALRRQSLDLSWYTEGNLPSAFVRFPESWTPAQAKEFRDYMEQIFSGNDAMRAKFVPIPGGQGTGMDRVMPDPANDVEEYLLHVGLAAYAVSPMEMGFIRSSGGAGLGGKGVGEQQQDMGRERQIGLSRHVTGIVDRIIAEQWTPEVGLFFDDLQDREDSLQEAQTVRQYWEMGAMSTDYIAENITETDPPGLDNTVISGQGTVMLVSDFKQQSPTGEPTEPDAPPTPSNTPGQATTADRPTVTKGIKYKGDLAKIVHRYLLRSYDPRDCEWALDPAIDWEFDDHLGLDKINMLRRPGGRNPEKVESIAGRIDRGASIDPIVVVDFDPASANSEAGLTIADGFHRTAGAEDAGEKDVPAFVGRNVPAKYKPLITGPMQADSTSVDAKKAAAAELGRWERKALSAVKRGRPADVPFVSEIIPAIALEGIAARLRDAATADAVRSAFR